MPGTIGHATILRVILRLTAILNITSSFHSNSFSNGYNGYIAGTFHAQFDWTWFLRLVSIDPYQNLGFSMIVGNLSP